MWRQPFVVCRITGKAPPQLVVDPTPDHLVQAQAGLVQGGSILREVVIVKQKADRKGLGKFRSPAKTTFLLVSSSQQLVADLSQHLRREGIFAFAITNEPDFASMIGQVTALLFNLRPFLLEGPGNSTQHVFPGGPVINGPGREISAAVKRFAFGGEKYIEWPAAAAGDSLHGVHIDMVEVGPFFPVDLDVDEMFVHETGRVRVFEAFSFHYMTPVTGGITDAYQNGLVLRTGFLQSFFTPGKPIHWVMCVLQ